MDLIHPQYIIRLLGDIGSEKDSVAGRALARSAVNVAYREMLHARNTHIVWFVKHKMKHCKGKLSCLQFEAKWHESDLARGSACAITMTRGRHFRARQGPFPGISSPNRPLCSGAYSLPENQQDQRACCISGPAFAPYHFQPMLLVSKTIMSAREKKATDPSPSLQLSNTKDAVLPKLRVATESTEGSATWSSDRRAGGGETSSSNLNIYTTHLVSSAFCPSTEKPHMSPRHKSYRHRAIDSLDHSSFFPAILGG